MTVGRNFEPSVIDLSNADRPVPAFCGRNCTPFELLGLGGASGGVPLGIGGGGVGTSDFGLGVFWISFFGNDGLWESGGSGNAVVSGRIVMVSGRILMVSVIMVVSGRMVVVFRSRI